MWTSQVYGHHDKMARTKTHRTSQTRSIQRRNIHKEITIFCHNWELKLSKSIGTKYKTTISGQWFPILMYTCIQYGGRFAYKFLSMFFYLTYGRGNHKYCHVLNFKACFRINILNAITFRYETSCAIYKYNCWNPYQYWF